MQVVKDFISHVEVSFLFFLDENLIDFLHLILNLTFTGVAKHDFVKILVFDF